MSPSNNIVVLGASAGGVESLREVVNQLPANFPARVFVVLHVPPYQASALPKILSTTGSLPAIHAEDGAKIDRAYLCSAARSSHAARGRPCRCEEDLRRTASVHRSMRCFGRRLITIERMR